MTISPENIFSFTSSVDLVEELIQAIGNSWDPNFLINLYIQIFAEGYTVPPMRNNIGKYFALWNPEEWLHWPKAMINSFWFSAILVFQNFSSIYNRVQRYCFTITTESTMVCRRLICLLNESRSPNLIKYVFLLVKSNTSETKKQIGSYHRYKVHGSWLLRKGTYFLSLPAMTILQLFFAWSI